MTGFDFRGQCLGIHVFGYTLLVVLCLSSPVQANSGQTGTTMLVPAAAEHNIIRQALNNQSALSTLGFNRNSQYDFSQQPAPAVVLADLRDSVTLQNAAAVHAQSCIFDHFDNAYGENLFVVTGSGWTIEQAISSWALEAQHYNYDDLSCVPDEVCGHYTQMVADNINVVGCAIQQCSQMTEATGNVIFDGRSGLSMVCYYDRIGNIDGQPPYSAAPETGLAFKMKVMLQGAYQAAEGMMKMPAATQQLPVSEPYSQLGYTVLDSGLLNNELLHRGTDNAIVDWVLVELRAAAAPANVLARKAFLLQRDGDLISPEDGGDVLSFAGYAGGNYYIAVRHHNHLGVMTRQALALSPAPVSIDFSAPSTPVWGQHARFESAGRALLWAGDSNHDGLIIGDGVANDSGKVLESVLLSANNTGLSVNYIAQDSDATDLNLDGQTVFAGVNNDTNLIHATVLLHPANTLNISNFIVSQQIP